MREQNQARQVSGGEPKNGLPVVTITIERWNGKLAGAILFFLIRREANGAQTGLRGAPEPLLKASDI
jgi:hypothetical protein